MRKLLIAGNWKMNGSLALASEMLQALKQELAENSKVESRLFPSFVHVAQMIEMSKGTSVSIGAQNVSEKSNGAFTGEVSLELLRDAGVGHVLLGHSERRSIYHESDDLIFDKTCQAIEQGMHVTFCVGESLAEREAQQTHQVVASQLKKILDSASLLQHITIAYEPVWAIGTGKTATPEQAQDVHAFIRSKLAEVDADRAESMQILYGGSMNAGNGRELIAQQDIDGGLVGGASLKLDAFLGIFECIRQF
jgi:triosephosphate isomerase